MRATRALVVAATAVAALGLGAPMAAAGGDVGNNQNNGNNQNDWNDQGGWNNGNNNGNGNGNNNGNNNGNGNGNNNGNNNGRNNGPNNVTVDPERVHQGAAMQVSAEGCGRGGSVSSNAFRTTRLSAGRVGHARVRILNDATPGSYNLTVRCDGTDRTAGHRFTVLDSRGAQGGLGGSMAATPAEMGVGAGLVASAALGGGMYLMRRRRTGHGAV
ncbi:MULTISPECIES: hypothetical protein [unclassified Streptomyces]|uniref:hypothetical protein n=1 Tax=unclassified Streptomyces TaxID=2593676 RepID=UPI00036B055E|nr:MULTISPECIES: hypothetical protein [unclassified Streptomyces]MYY04701.1 hypothetical protein [Streptomyces sp. SID4913]